MNRSAALEEVYTAQRRVADIEHELASAKEYLAEANFDLQMSECDHLEWYTRPGSSTPFCSHCDAFVEDPEQREFEDTVRVLIADAAH